MVMCRTSFNSGFRVMVPLISSLIPVILAPIPYVKTDKNINTVRR